MTQSYASQCCYQCSNSTSLRLWSWSSVSSVMRLYLYSVCLICRVSRNTFKGNAQFIFLCNLQKSLFNFCLIMILKSNVTKKVIMGFNNLGEENFPTSIMVLFEIHQKFKGHFLNELCVSFKWHSICDTENNT